MSTVVAAVGGNALLRRGQAMTWANQVDSARRAARALAPLTRHARLVVTHGNGPQVGLLAAETERGTSPLPLDVLDAETQGQIGYLLALELGNVLPDLSVVTVLTQVEVDPDDPARAAPSKPIGPVLDEADAARLRDERGWNVQPDGHGWRRVVASPEPLRVLDQRAVEVLLESGHVVVCAGGGGIPVQVRDRQRRGVEAVVDKDLTASHLAGSLGAEVLLLLTDVDAVHDDWGTDRSRPIASVSVAALRARSFPAGSMGPKVEAACRFAERGGRAAIGRLDEAEALHRGTVGTQVTDDGGR